MADSLKGLVQVKFPKEKQQSNSAITQKDMTITILSNSVDGAPINYANDLDIDHKNQLIYFTSSTRGTVAYNANLGHYDTMRSFMLDLYSGDVSGKLLKYNLKTKEVSVVIEGLWYANGVTLSPQNDYVLVVETCGFRVIRKWLKSDKEEDFISNLPGAPDGITQSSDGNYWISLVAPISPLLKFIGSPQSRYIMSILQFDLDISKYFLKQWGCVIKVSADGAILDVLIDQTGSIVSSISSVTEHDGKLFFGNLGGSFVSVYDLSKMKE